MCRKWCLPLLGAAMSLPEKVEEPESPIAETYCLREAHLLGADLWGSGPTPREAFRAPQQPQCKLWPAMTSGSKGWGRGFLAAQIINE